MNRFITFVSALLLAVSLATASEDLRNPSEDFVRASVMVASPGDALYSRTGHAFIRMQCPSRNMDFCFSYESEDADAKVMKFLAGKLRMGLVGMRTAQYLSEYENEGRGVTEYSLNLPVKVKQNLWRVLDRHVDEGMDLPYDYLDRGCAISVIHLLEEATFPRGIAVGDVPSEYSKTRREILSDELEASPWSRLMINVLTNGSANDEVEIMEKAITPASLVAILSGSTYDGVPLLGGEEVRLAPAQTARPWRGVTPMMLGACMVILSVYFAIKGSRWILWMSLALTTAFGLFNFYLVFVSRLCATEWSWLVIPFNPLPALLWRWRRGWLIPFGTACVIWALSMSLAPGALTDPALALAAAAAGVIYLSEGIRMRPEMHGRLLVHIHRPQSQLKTNQ